MSEKSELEVVAYLRATPDGKPEWDEDCVCQDAIYPNYDGDETVSMPMVRQADAERVINGLSYQAELYDEVWGKARSMGFSNVTMALAEIDQLRAEVEALREDASRLDRLDIECEAYGCEGIHEGNRWMIDGPFRTVRDALDAAMAAKEGV